MKKITAILILTSLLMSVSCGGENPSADDTTTAPSGDGTTAAPVEEYAYPAIDLGGEKFAILNTSQTYGFYSAIDFESSTGETLDDAVYNRNRTLEDKFKFEMEVTEQPLYDAPGYLKNIILSGDDVYDVAFLINTHIGSLSDEGCFADLDTLDGFNFDAEWWESEVIETARTASGRLEYAMTDASLVDFEGTIATFFNKRLFEENQLDEPYALVKEGKWTLDEMAKLAAAGANLNGDSDWTPSSSGNSVYGLVTWNTGYDAFIVGADIDYLSTKNGKMSFGLNNERFYQTADKLFTIFNDEGTFRLLDTSRGIESEMHYEKTFKNGRALMVVAELKAGNKYRDMVDDFGVLPLPKLDESQENYSNFRGFSYAMCIPVTNQDADNTAAIMDAMSYLTSKDVIPAFYEGKLVAKQLRDEESIEMLEIIRATRKYEPAVIFSWFNNTRYAIRQTFVNGNNTFASDIAAMENTINAEIEKLTEK